MTGDQRVDIYLSTEELTQAELDAVEIYIKRLIDTRGTTKHDQIIYCHRERKFV